MKLRNLLLINTFRQDLTNYNSCRNKFEINYFDIILRFIKHVD